MEGNTVIFPQLVWVVYYGNSRYLYCDPIQMEIELPQEVIDMLSGVEEVVVDESTDTPVYYNLQGSRITNPAKGSIVIERRGNSARKIRY